MKILLIAQEYTINQILTKLGFITNYSIEEVILLRELVPRFELLDLFDVRITIEENLERAMLCCSDVWIFDNGVLSKEKIILIEQTANNINRHVMRNPDFWTAKASAGSPNVKSLMECNSKIDLSLPTVLICNIGRYSQLCSLEILSTVLFEKYGISANHAFSKPLRRFLGFLKESNIQISNCFGDDVTKEMNIVTIDNVELDYSLETNKCLHDIALLKPDAILFTIDRMYLDLNPARELAQLLAHRIGLAIDFMFISNYRSVKLSESLCEYMKVSKTNLFNCGGGTIIGEQTINKSIVDVIAKIAIPDGIEQIIF